MPQTILIVEDDISVRESLAAWLSDEGFAILEAATISAGLSLFHEGQPDLVLLDLGIGTTDGMDMLREMKRLRNETPVIIVSGRTQITDAIEAFKAGAWDYVTKPIPSLPVFSNTIRNCLDQTRLHCRVRETQDHLYRLVQNLPVVIFIINRNLEFEFLNQTTEHVLGYAPEEILESPKPFLRCIMPEDRKKFMSALRESFHEHAGPLRLEFNFLHKKGYQVHLLAQSIAYSRQQPGPPDRLEGMIMDMTRHSYLEKLLHQNEKLSLLRTMTEEVAHEIRNPLVSLGGFARKLQTKYPDATEAQVILEECERLERMVQRINNYLEPIEPHFIACSLITSLSFAQRLMQSRLERQGVSCVAEIQMDLANVQADPDILHRVFMNVLSLGVDMIDRGGHISINAIEANDLVTLTFLMEPVHGHLPSTAQQLLPFESGDHASLSLCYRLTELLRGHFSVTQTDINISIQLTLLKFINALVFRS